jgi:hypothetical protein
VCAICCLSVGGTACPKIVAYYDGSHIATGIYLQSYPLLNRPQFNENQMKMSGKTYFWLEIG